MKFSPEDILALRALAIQAGDAIMHIYNTNTVEVDTKSDDSPVTQADIAADKIISDVLRSRFPNETIITEEQAQSHELSAENFFIIDPLDGTKEFIKRRGEFTVNIAYVEAGIPVMGIVYAPALDRIFYTNAKGQAVQERGHIAQTPAAVEPLTIRDSDNDGLYVVASKSHRDQATDDYIARYAVADSLSAGSSLKFCLVASGEADIYPRLGPTMEWDTAAGDAVVRAAGGEVVDFDTHEPLKYGKPEYRNGFFIVKTPQVALKA